MRGSDTTANSATDPVIRVSDLRKTYGQTTAVDGAAFMPLWLCFAVLAAFLVICFAISARFFRWQ